MLLSFVILVWYQFCNFFSVAPSKRQHLTTILQQIRLFHKTPKQIFLFNLFQVSKHWMNTDWHFVKDKYNRQHVSSPKFIEEMRHPSCYINVTLESLSKYLDRKVNTERSSIENFETLSFKYQNWIYPI